MINKYDLVEKVNELHKDCTWDFADAMDENDREWADHYDAKGRVFADFKFIMGYRQIKYITATEAKAWADVAAEFTPKSEAEKYGIKDALESINAVIDELEDCVCE